MCDKLYDVEMEFEDRPTRGRKTAVKPLEDFEMEFDDSILR